MAIERPVKTPEGKDRPTSKQLICRGFFCSQKIHRGKSADLPQTASDGKQTEGLQRLAEAINSKTFDPREATRTFRIAMSDYAAMTLLPSIIDRIGSTGPQINLRIFPASRLDLVEYLDSGQVEMAVGWFANLPPACDACRSSPSPKAWSSAPATL